MKNLEVQKKKNIVVKDKIIHITGVNDDNYVSLTDLARFLNEDDPRYPIQNWMRLNDIIDFIGLWEILNDETFNRIEFDAVKMQLVQLNIHNEVNKVGDKLGNKNLNVSQIKVLAEIRNNPNITKPECRHLK